MQMSNIRLPLAPVLATLLGGLSPFAAPPATAQTSPVAPTKTYGLKPIVVLVREGEEATLTLELGEKAPEGGLDFEVEADFESNSVLNASSADRADVGDFQKQVDVEKGKTTATVEIPIRADNLTEGIEAFVVKITKSPPGWIPERSATGPRLLDQTPVIIIDVPPPLPVINFTKSEYSIPEAGDSSEQIVTLRASRELTEPITVNLDMRSKPPPRSKARSGADEYALSPGNPVAFKYPCREGADYATVDAVEFPAGKTEHEVSILVCKDDLVEGNEDFTMRIKEGEDYSVGETKKTTVTIRDEVSPKDGISIGNSTPATEGHDDHVRFKVRVFNRGSGQVKVDYETWDPHSTRYGNVPATAGLDYTATSGTLTFEPGETEKWVDVPVLDDAIDEGSEYFWFLLSNPQGGAFLKTERRRRIGLIVNDDPLPSAWTVRFGRTVSQQVVDALQQRFRSRPPSGLQLTVAGEDLSSDPPLAENHVLLSRLLGFGSMSSQELAQGSSFSFSPEGAGPRLSFWGKGALSSFNGAEETVSQRGDVTTALVGGEWSAGRWQAGAALSHSWGSGSYEGEGAGGDGRISATLTGLFPYGRYALTPRLGIWATAGYGWGSLTLNPDGDGPEYTPAMTMSMGALGMDGLLLDGGSEGFSLATTADVLLLKTSSAAVAGLESSEGNVSRLRLGLEATRPFLLSEGASLSPALELGVRQDGGDAETGFGMELGAGLTWSVPESGITAALKGRTLLSHGAEDFQDQGLALSFSWEPDSSKRGPSLSLSQAVGLPAEGGLAALLNPTAIEVLDTVNDDGQRFEARLSYGFPAAQDRLTVTPGVGLSLSPDSRTYSLSWSVAPYGEQLHGESWELSLAGERQEAVSSSSAVDHSLKLRFSLLR